MSRIRFLHFIQPSFLWNEVINLSLPTLGIVKCQMFLHRSDWILGYGNYSRKKKELFLLFLNLYIFLRINFNILYKYSDIRYNDNILI